MQTLPQDTIWSFSKLKMFEMCPYQFYLTYVHIPHIEKKPLFFSDYGSFIHEVIEMYLHQKLTKDQAAAYYLSHFRERVVGLPPNMKIYNDYFQQGLEYMRSYLETFPHKNILSVESKIDFCIYDHGFVGIIDCVARNNSGDLVIVDNKSRTLKPRSNRVKPTKSDIELDEYLRQLYLYSVAVYQKYNEKPKFLEFNCFRTYQFISEPFSEQKLNDAMEWANRTIEEITTCTEWNPSIDYWKCKHLCNVNEQCEFYQINFGR